MSLPHNPNNPNDRSHDKWVETLKFKDRDELSVMLAQESLNGDLRRMKVLLNHGASPNYKASWCIMQALRGGHDDAFFLLINQTDISAEEAENMLYEAAEYNAVEPVKYFIKTYPDVVRETPEALEAAVLHNAADTAKLLLDHGADPNDTNLALINVAISHGYGDLIPLLLDNGARPDQLYQGKTAFEWAERMGDTKSQTLLNNWATRQTRIKLEESFFDNKTMDDLRKAADKPYLDGDTNLIMAARGNKFAKVMEISKQDKNPLTLNDCLKKDKSGANLLDVLATHGRLSDVFNAGSWAQDATTARSLLDNIPKGYAHQVNKEDFLKNLSQQRLRRLSPKRPPKP